MCYGGSADSCLRNTDIFIHGRGDGSLRRVFHGCRGDNAPASGVCPWTGISRRVRNGIRLAVSVGGASVAGTALKSMSEWLDSGNGTDFYGFGALPGGYCCYNGSYDDAGKYAYFWSATENDASYAYFRHLYYGDAETIRGLILKHWRFSVRCVKD